MLWRSLRGWVDADVAAEIERVARHDSAAERKRAEAGKGRNVGSLGSHSLRSSAALHVLGLRLRLWLRRQNAAQHGDSRLAQYMFNDGVS